MFGIYHRVDCRAHDDIERSFQQNDRCQLDIVTLTDNTVSKKKKQVYLSGTLHGNEILGPNTMYYFIEYMLSSYDNVETTKHILQNLEIIITPMTNAVGFYRN